VTYDGSLAMDESEEERETGEDDSKLSIEKPTLGYGTEMSGKPDEEPLSLCDTLLKVILFRAINL
jgi:hypothetical protein